MKPHRHWELQRIAAEHYVLKSGGRPKGWSEGLAVDSCLQLCMLITDYLSEMGDGHWAFVSS